MRVLVLLLCWFLRRRLDLAEVLAPDTLWRRGRTFLPEAARRPGTKVSAIVTLVYVVLILLIAIASFLLWQGLGAPATGVLALALFATTTGMPGWRQPLESYAAAWQRGDVTAAWNHVQHLLPAQDRSRASAPETLHLLLSETLIVQTFERYFLPAFWFVILGPVGVVAVTLAAGLRNHYPQENVRLWFGKWCGVLGWLPAQLLSLTFGFAGDLAGWLQSWRFGQLSWKDYGLFNAASSALSSYALDPAAFERHNTDQWTDFADRSLRAVRDLLNRSMWVWICLAALVSIIGLVP